MTTMTRPLETGHLDDTPVEDSLLRRFLHNQADLTAVTAEAAGGRVLRRPDLVAGRFDAARGYQNHAVLLQPASEAALDAAEAFFAAAGDEATLLSAWPGADLTDRGWQLMGHPMFVVRAPGRMELTPPADVSVDVVCWAEQTPAVGDLVARAYPVPDAPWFPDPAAVPAYLLRTGALDGVPVAAAASHVGRGVVNLCLAATLPQARRRGVWSALVAARVNDRPDLPACAVTSDDSRPGFVALGFLPVARMTMWQRPAS